MKKLLLVSTILLLTGCFGETGKGYITKTCKKIEQVNKINIYKNITLKSKQGNLTYLTINEKYETESDMTSIINSKKSEANMYTNETGINTNIEDNIITYHIDITKASELVIERFNIKKETHKMIKYYEEKGYTCE